MSEAPVTPRDERSVHQLAVDLGIQLPGEVRRLNLTGKGQKRVPVSVGFLAEGPKDNPTAIRLLAAWENFDTTYVETHGLATSPDRLDRAAQWCGLFALTNETTQFRGCWPRPMHRILWHDEEARLLQSSLRSLHQGEALSPDDERVVAATATLLGSREHQSGHNIASALLLITDQQLSPVTAE